MYAWTGSIRQWAPRRSVTDIGFLIRSSRLHTSGQSNSPKAETSNQQHAIPTKPGTLQDGLGQEDGLARGRYIPLSPFMDPEFKASREKYKLPKASPSKTPTPFQEQLAKNPYARALASPVRMCAITRTVLPKYFLQDFELIEHPKTKEPWYLPRSLTSPYLSQASDPPQSSIAGPLPIPMDSETLVPLEKPLHSPTRGPKGYTLSRHELLAGTNRGNSGYSKGWQRFPSPKALQYRAFQMNKIRWRADIDTFVLSLLRKRAIESLTHLATRQKGYLTKCQDLADAKGKKQVGAILWFGGDPEPGEFATVDVERAGKGRKTPVHNMPQLLGDQIEDLKSKSPGIFDLGMVALKHRNMTVATQLLLWKLQGYLAQYDNERVMTETLQTSKDG